MKITNKMVNRFIGETGVKEICPFCDCKDWYVSTKTLPNIGVDQILPDDDTHYFELKLLAPPFVEEISLDTENGLSQLMPTGNLMPLMVFYCAKCSFVRFHSYMFFQRWVKDTYPERWPLIMVNTGEQA